MESYLIIIHNTCLCLTSFPLVNDNSSYLSDDRLWRSSLGADRSSVARVGVGLPSTAVLGSDEGLLKDGSKW